VEVSNYTATRAFNRLKKGIIPKQNGGIMRNVERQKQMCLRLLTIVILVSSFSIAHAESFVAPSSGTLYVKCVAGSAGAVSTFGTGTSIASFVPYLNSVPKSCPTTEVSIGTVTAGQTVVFGIHTLWNGKDYWAFSNATDLGSIVSFTDVNDRLGMVAR
jgi:hypothetical protein